MTPLPRWLQVLLLPVVFIGSCIISSQLVWKWQDYRLTRSVTAADSKLFPVLIRTTDGKYAVCKLGKIAADTSVVTSGFDEVAINRDLNASADSTRGYRYFRVIENTADSTTLSLKEPGLDDYEVQGWYQVTQGRVIPQRILFYFGPGISLNVMQWTIPIGLITTILFFKFVNRKRRTFA